MARPRIYHNPRCSKSRQALQLLVDQVGDESKIDVVKYLEVPPTQKALRALLKKLGMKPKDVLRRKEAPFKELDLKQHLDDDAFLIRAITEHPVLLERPIVELGASAELGRPPENVLRLFS